MDIQVHMHWIYRFNDACSMVHHSLLQAAVFYSIQESWPNLGLESVKMRTSPDDLGGNYDLNLFMESRDGQWLSVD